MNAADAGPHFRYDRVGEVNCEHGPGGLAWHECLMFPAINPCPEVTQGLQRLRTLLSSEFQEEEEEEEPEGCFLKIWAASLADFGVQQSFSLKSNEPKAAKGLGLRIGCRCRRRTTSGRWRRRFCFGFGDFRIRVSKRS